MRLTNRSDDHLHGWLAGALQNDVGGDGVVNPRGTRHPGYGGNTNRVERAGAGGQADVGQRGAQAGAAEHVGREDRADRHPGLDQRDVRRQQQRVDAGQHGHVRRLDARLGQPRLHLFGH